MIWVFRQRVVCSQRDTKISLQNSRKDRDQRIAAPVSSFRSSFVANVSSKVRHWLLTEKLCAKWHEFRGDL
ncbi:MAG: hypothetical protein EBT94_11870 [Alphaproteobacteria bacterium]|nr:hypothetical protein [Alphaproteobacteria bacterium]